MGSVLRPRSPTYVCPHLRRHTSPPLGPSCGVHTRTSGTGTPCPPHTHPTPRGGPIRHGDAVASPFGAAHHSIRRHPVGALTHVLAHARLSTRPSFTHQHRPAQAIHPHNPTTPQPHPAVMFRIARTDPRQYPAAVYSCPRWPIACLPSCVQTQNVGRMWAECALMIPHWVHQPNLPSTGTPM